MAMDADNSDVTFYKQLANLQQIVSGRFNFPILVKTRDKLRSFLEIPIDEEGKVLYLESQMALKYARIKVLNFPDEEKMEQERGTEFQLTHSTLVGEEFYIPLGCPGKLQIIPHPGKRQRYATISEVMQDNPRYVLSVSDVMAIPPRHATDTCLTHISAGTTLELKAVKQEKACRYLKCVDKNGGCYFLQEHCRVNFTAVLDSKAYTLQQLRDAGFPLPTPIQFKRGTISPYDVIPFHDAIANNTMVVTAGPLELLEIVTRTVLIAKVRDNDNHCFKTILLPQTLFENFHVQVGEFRTFETQSIFMERKFGGCRGDNDFISKKAYLMPTVDNQVCWLRDPEKLTGNVHFCDSSDSDSEYVIAEVGSLPPLPDRKSHRDIKEDERRLKEMHTVILLPTAKIQDQDVLLNIKAKSKLGFGRVHDELRRMIKGKKAEKPERSFSECFYESRNNYMDKSVKTNPKQVKKTKTKSKSVDETKNTNQSIDAKSTLSSVTRKPLPPLPSEKPPENMSKLVKSRVPNPKQVNDDLTKSTSVEKTKTANKYIGVEPPFSRDKGRRLPPLPPEEPLETEDNSDDEQHDYDYVDTTVITPPVPRDHKPENVTARIQPIFSQRHHTKPTAITSPIQRNQGVCDNSKSVIDSNPPMSPSKETIDETPESELDDQYYITPMPCNPAAANMQHTMQTSITGHPPRNPEAQGACNNSQAAEDSKPPIIPPEDTHTESPDSELDCQDYLVPSPSSPNEVTVQSQRNLSDKDFFTFSVSETVECLKTCRMESLAQICKEKNIDGEFFQNTEQSILEDSFGLSRLDSLKLRKICQGWRPKNY